MNVRGWKPRSIDGTDTPKCDVMDGGEVAMYVHKARTGPSAADLIPLELWYRPGDHYLVASAAGIADAKSHGYVKQETLGYVWPPPGSVPGVASRYGLPSISKDDRACEHRTPHCRILVRNACGSCFYPPLTSHAFLLPGNITDVDQDYWHGKCRFKSLYHVLTLVVYCHSTRPWPPMRSSAGALMAAYPPCACRSNMGADDTINVLGT